MLTSPKAIAAPLILAFVRLESLVQMCSMSGSALRDFFESSDARIVAVKSRNPVFL